MPDRRIAHLDMDAFYASVELLRRPELRGLPVVVGGRRLQASDSSPPRLRDYAGRGVVTTCTYAARALGVHSGMALMRAARLAPDALLLPPDFDAYRRTSRQFKSAVAAIAPTLEDRGIDEIYLDLTALPQATRPLARALKEAVLVATGLTCSIGIASNKLLAKIASDLEKPDGLTVLDPEDLAQRIWPLEVRRINGIGPKASNHLQRLGIDRIGDLAQADPHFLQQHFGTHYGTWLHQAAHGLDDRPVVTASEPKSVSRESTFERDLHPREDRPLLTAILVGLCTQVAADLERKQCYGRTVGVKLRYDNFQSLTRNLTLQHPVRDPETLLAASRDCLRRVPLDRRLRLLGVRVSSLVPEHRPGPGELDFGPEPD